VPGDEPKSVEQQIQDAIKQAMADEKAVQEAARLAAEKEAQAKDAEASKRGKEAYFTGLQEEYKARAADYPFLTAEAVDRPEIDAWMQQEYNRTLKIPTPQQVLDHFEEVQKARAARLAAPWQRLNGGQNPTPAPTGQKPVQGNPSAALRVGVDTQGKAPGPRRDDDEPLDAVRARIMRELDARGRA
jgi:hypothetical protein